MYVYNTFLKSITHFNISDISFDILFWILFLFLRIHSLGIPPMIPTPRNTITVLLHLRTISSIPLMYSTHKITFQVMFLYTFSKTMITVVLLFQYVHKCLNLSIQLLTLRLILHITTGLVIGKGLTTGIFTCHTTHILNC